MPTSLPLTSFTLFLTFLRAVGLTPGGGYATVPPLRKRVVEKYAWMSDEDFASCLAVAQAMPGIFTLNLAAYTGRKLFGWRGSVVALVGALLPAVVVMLVFATFYDDFRSLSGVENFLRGARPAIVALILLPALQMWRQWRVMLSTIWLPIGAAIGIGFLGVSPAYIVAALVALGVLYGIFVHN